METIAKILGWLLVFFLGFGGLAVISAGLLLKKPYDLDVSDEADDADEPQDVNRSRS